MTMSAWNAWDYLIPPVTNQKVMCERECWVSKSCSMENGWQLDSTCKCTRVGLTSMGCTRFWITRAREPQFQKSFRNRTWTGECLFGILLSSLSRRRCNTQYRSCRLAQSLRRARWRKAALRGTIGFEKITFQCAGLTSLNIQYHQLLARRTLQ